MLMHFDKPVGSKGATKPVFVTWPTGFNVLPDEGGVNDQDYQTMRFLMAALRGDQAGTARKMSKA